MGQPWHGLGTKLALLSDRLARPDVSATTVVVFVDAFDVVSVVRHQWSVSSSRSSCVTMPQMFVHPPEVIVDKYRLRGPNAGVVFGGECSCFPAGARRAGRRSQRLPPLCFVALTDPVRWQACWTTPRATNTLCPPSRRTGS